MERTKTKTTKRTTARKRARRHISWRNVGWFVSWSLFFAAVAQMMHCCITTMKNNGVNPLESKYWVMGIYILIIIWVGWRNAEGPLDYIADWKYQQRKKKKRK